MAMRLDKAYGRGNSKIFQSRTHCVTQWKSPWASRDMVLQLIWNNITRITKTSKCSDRLHLSNWQWHDNRDIYGVHYMAWHCVSITEKTDENALRLVNDELFQVVFQFPQCLIWLVKPGWKLFLVCVCMGSWVIVLCSILYIPIIITYYFLFVNINTNIEVIVVWLTTWKLIPARVWIPRAVVSFPCR